MMIVVVFSICPAWLLGLLGCFVFVPTAKPSVHELMKGLLFSQLVTELMLFGD